MVTIGADPEFFVTDYDSGRPIPMCGKVGGTKGKPLKLGDGIAVQEDNVMVEWNIPPCTDRVEFSRAITRGFQKVWEHVVTSYPGTEDIEWCTSASQLFPVSALKGVRGAMDFGCSPDFNAYTRGTEFARVQPLQLVRDDYALRFAGGHVHIGYDNPEDVPPFVVAALADLFIGVPSIIRGDWQSERRELYGQPGRYRPTPYGIEYRTLSPFWTTSSGEAHRVGHNALELGRLIESGDIELIQRIYRDTDWNGVQAIISEEQPTGSTNMHRHTVKTYGLEIMA